MLAKTLNRILMPKKKTPKTECDMVLWVRNSCQKNRISAHPRQIFSKNYQILAIFVVFCHFHIFFGLFSQIKAKIRKCHEISMKIDPKNVKIGPLGPIFENCSNQPFFINFWLRDGTASKTGAASAASYSWLSGPFLMFFGSIFIKILWQTWFLTFKLKNLTLKNKN